MASKSRDRRVSFWARKTRIRLWTRIGWGLAFFGRMQSQCADPGGWSSPDGQKTAWTTFFFFCFLLVLNLFYSYRGGSMVLLQRKLYFSKDRGGPTFPRGRGVQVLISIETHINCDFPGRSGPPIIPRWICTWSHRRITLPHYMCKLPGIHFTSMDMP